MTETKRATNDLPTRRGATRPGQPCRSGDRPDLEVPTRAAG